MKCLINYSSLLGLNVATVDAELSCPMGQKMKTRSSFFLQVKNRIIFASAL